MAKNTETKEVAPVDVKSNLPAHLQKPAAVKAGNLDSSDRIIPRIKLMQGISPELTAYNDAKNGEFWHTLAEKSLGDSFRFVVIRVHKTLVLWAPRGDERGILARSNDGKTWDKPDETFEVKLKTSPTKQKWMTKGSVAESGLAEFGSSVKEDPNSPPAAALTYNWLILPIDEPELGVAVLINSRSAVKPAKNLWSKIDTGDVPFYYRIYEAKSKVEGQGSDVFNNYQYTSDGYVEDPDLAAYCEKLAIEFEKLDYRSNDENADVDNSEGGSGGGRQRGQHDEGMAKKF
jgi:hypothetical protein